MYKVTRGAIHHLGVVYRKGDELPETFTNKDKYKHVELVEEKPKKQVKKVAK